MPEKSPMLLIQFQKHEGVQTKQIKWKAPNKDFFKCHASWPLWYDRELQGYFSSQELLKFCVCWSIHKTNKKMSLKPQSEQIESVQSITRETYLAFSLM